MLFTTPSIENYLSGVILFDESVRQNLHVLLMEKGIVAGIKVDEGLEKFEDTDQDITKGLENLDARLKQYAGLGLKFAKWRGVFKINDLYPSESFINENLERMANYALFCQQNNIVPIVEPEILLDGNHTTTRCSEISVVVWQKLFEKLKEKNVDLRNLLLKTSMILPGDKTGINTAPFEIAQFTLRGLQKTVPPEVPGIVFLSGGQTSDMAIANLNEIVKQGKDVVPWQLSFSFSRALQEETMKIWSGLDENVTKAQDVFRNKLEMVCRARKGEL
jgi:fructose-bisphosphate aldolase class I